MKKLKAWMAEHKKFSVIALCLLLMFTCGSAMSAINVSHHRAETAKEQNAGNNTDTTTAAEKKTKEETGKVELTDAQKEIIKGYDTDAKELIDTLSSSVWSVSEGRYTLKFADDSYVETVNGTPTVHSYAISRVEKTSDGYGGYLYTIVFETDTGTHIVTYTDGSGAAVNSDSKTPGENTISTLTAISSRVRPTPSSVNCMMPLPAMLSRLTVRLSLLKRPSRLRTPQVPSRLTTLSIPTTSRGRPSWSMRRLPMQRVRSSPSIGTNPTFPSR